MIRVCLVPRLLPSLFAHATKAGEEPGNEANQRSIVAYKLGWYVIDGVYYVFSVDGSYCRQFNIGMTGDCKVNPQKIHEVHWAEHLPCAVFEAESLTANVPF